MIIKLVKNQKIKPGKLPEADYKKGICLYVGRARTGLKARVKRNIRSHLFYFHSDIKGLGSLRNEMGFEKVGIDGNNL